jgi:hypothetical protein
MFTIQIQWLFLKLIILFDKIAILDSAKLLSPFLLSHLPSVVHIFLILRTIARMATNAYKTTTKIRSATIM